MQAIYMSQYTTGNMVHLEIISDDVNIDTYVFMNAPDRNTLGRPGSRRLWL